MTTTCLGEHVSSDKSAPIEKAFLRVLSCNNTAQRAEGGTRRHNDGSTQLMPNVLPYLYNRNPEKAAYYLIAA
jgi:hypothetical protein